MSEPTFTDADLVVFVALAFGLGVSVTLLLMSFF